MGILWAYGLASPEMLPHKNYLLVKKKKYMENIGKTRGITSIALCSHLSERNY